MWLFIYDFGVRLFVFFVVDFDLFVIFVVYFYVIVERGFVRKVFIVDFVFEGFFISVDFEMVVKMVFVVEFVVILFVFKRLFI